MPLFGVILKTWRHHRARSIVTVLAIAVASYFLAKSPIVSIDVDHREACVFRTERLDQATVDALRAIDAPITLSAPVVLTLTAERAKSVRTLIPAHHRLRSTSGGPADEALLSARLVELLRRQLQARIGGAGRLQVDWGAGARPMAFRTAPQRWERLPLQVLLGAAREQGSAVRVATFADRRTIERIAALVGEPLFSEDPAAGSIELRIADSDALVAAASWMLIGLLLLFAVYFDRGAREAELALLGRLGATAAQLRRLLIGELCCSTVIGVAIGFVAFIAIDDHGLRRVAQLSSGVTVGANLIGAAAAVLLVAYVGALLRHTRQHRAPPSHRRWVLAGLAAFVAASMLLWRIDPSWLPLMLHRMPWRMGLLLLTLVLFFAAGGFVVARFVGLLFGRSWATLAGRGTARFALLGIRWLRGFDVLGAMVLAIAVGVAIMGAAYSHTWNRRDARLPRIETLDFLPRLPGAWLAANTPLSPDQLEELRLVELSRGRQTLTYLLAVGPRTMRAFEPLLSGGPADRMTETIYWQAGIRYMPEVRQAIPPALRQHQGRVRGVGGLAAGVISWKLADRLAEQARGKLRVVQDVLGHYAFVPGGLRTRDLGGSVRRWDAADLIYDRGVPLRPQPPRLRILAFRDEGRNVTLLGLLGLGMLAVVLAGVSLQQQRRDDVPSLKQLGATRGQIFWGTWIEHGLVCLLATFGGCLLSLLPAHLLLRTASRLFDVATPQLQLPWWWIAQLSAIAVAVPMLVLALLSWRASRIPPLRRPTPEALRARRSSPAAAG